MLLPNACGYIKDRYSYHHTTQPGVTANEPNTLAAGDRSFRTASAAAAPQKEAVSMSLPLPLPLDKAVLIAPARGVSGELSRQLQSALQNYNTAAAAAASTSAASSTTTTTTTSTPSLSFAHIRDLYPHFQYSDLAAHPAIVVLPYQVSFMSLFEFYRMEVSTHHRHIDTLDQYTLPPLINNLCSHTSNQQASTHITTPHQ